MKLQLSPLEPPLSGLRLAACSSRFPTGHARKQIFGSNCVRLPAMAGAHPETQKKKKRPPAALGQPRYPPWLRHHALPRFVIFYNSTSAHVRRIRCQMSSAVVSVSAPVSKVVCCPTSSEVILLSNSSAISACEKDGQWPQALGLLFSMRHNHLLPEVISYNIHVKCFYVHSGPQ